MFTQVLAALILTASVWGFKQGSARGRMGLQRWVAMSESTAQQPSSKKAYRIFNAASLPELLNPISEAEAKSLDKVQDVLKKAGLTSEKKFDDDLVSTRGPNVGNDGSLASKLVDSMTKPDGLDNAAEPPSAIDTSFVVWAETTDAIEEGVVLMNHWAQRAVVITSYDPTTGAKGYELNGLTIASPSEVAPAARAEFTYTWPPLALEMELVDRKWQPCKVSGNISNQEIFQFFPEEVRKTQTVAWELVFLLLLSNERDDDAEVIQALLDTGISPRKGLIAYMRLFKRVSDRTAVLSEVPPYRRIQSVDRDFES